MSIIIYKFNATDIDTGGLKKIGIVTNIDILPLSDFFWCHIPC